MPKNLILHIGTGKTGTTSIQHLLTVNRQQLREQHQIDYLEFGLDIQPQQFGGEVGTHGDLVRWASTDNHRRLNALGRQIDKSTCDTVVISSENFYHQLNPAQVQSLADAIGPGHRVQVLCYVRRQDDYMESAWKQQVRVGAMRSAFPTFLARHTSTEFLAEAHANYHRMLLPWAQSFGRQALRIQVFDRKEFVHGDLIDDFLALCNPQADYSTLLRPRPNNPSLSTELAVLLRQINLMGLVNKTEQAELVAFLERHHAFQNPPLLSAHDRQRILANYRQSNEQLFTELAGRAVPAGFLPEHLELPAQDSKTVYPKTDELALQLVVGLFRAGVGAGQPPAPTAGTAVSRWWQRWRQR